MILIDTSVWIDFLHSGGDLLEHVLSNGDAVIHPFVLGELALGSIRNRALMFQLLNTLPSALVARNVEVLAAIENWSLSNSGLGYVDVHLLCSVSLMAGCRLYTHDKRLQLVAEVLHLALALN